MNISTTPTAIQKTREFSVWPQCPQTAPSLPTILSLELRAKAEIPLISSNVDNFPIKKTN